MKLTWPHVAVIGMIVTGVVILAILQPEQVTAFIGLAIAILLGVGLVQQGEIKNAANGNTSRLVSLMETMTGHLAQSATPPSVPAPPSSDPVAASVTEAKAN